MRGVRVSATLQDYLETILQLSENGGRARISDIASVLRNSKPSVTQAVGVLRSMRLVSQDKYGPVHLTPEGVKHARKVLARHKALTRFLVDALGVNPAVAESDACAIEHAISDETFERLLVFMDGQSTLRSGN